MEDVKNELLHAINDAVIRRLATAQVYQRGADYFSHGHILSCHQNAEGLSAVVRGTKEYTVDLAAEDGILDYGCECPAGVEGNFCKHCVAVALYWLAHAPGTPKKARSGKKATLAEAAKVLQAEDKYALVRTIIEWAKDDNQLRERILLHVSRQLGPEAAVDVVRRAFEKAVRVRGYLNARETKAYVRGLDRAIDSIEQLLKDGQAAAVIELSESALGSLSDAADLLDDSDDRTRDLLDRLESIHFQACSEARPDPRRLAEFLFERGMDRDAEVFDQALADYAGILGDEGLKIYRELAEAEWAKVPVRTAKDKFSMSERSFCIRRVMETLADLSGDVEQLIAVLSRDLSHPYSYVRIAEVYREAGRHEEALRAAEEGLRAFPQYDDPRLRAFVADYHFGRNSST